MKQLKQSHLLTILQDNKYILCSFETFKQRVSAHTLRITRDLFLENEDYELLTSLESNPIFVNSTFIFLNIWTGRRLFVTKAEFYSESECLKILELARVKPDKVLLNAYYKITRGE